MLRLEKAIPLQKDSTRTALDPSLDTWMWSPWMGWNWMGVKLLVPLHFSPRFGFGFTDGGAQAK